MGSHRVLGRNRSDINGQRGHIHEPGPATARRRLFWLVVMAATLFWYWLPDFTSDCASALKKESALAA